MPKMGQRIKELRSECQLSQRELGEKIGVAQNTVAQYEKGSTKLGLDVLVKLTVALKTTSDYLLGLDE